MANSKSMMLICSALALARFPLGLWQLVFSQFPTPLPGFIFLEFFVSIKMEIGRRAYYPL
jgi:hypothetical protein